MDLKLSLGITTKALPILMPGALDTPFKTDV